MGLLNTYPTYFDNIEILSPHSWTETSEVIDVVNQTEAGTDQVDVTRYDKLTISASYSVAEVPASGNDFAGEHWAKIFKQFSKQNSITVKRYDILKEEYEERSMYMRDFSANLLYKSDRLTSNVSGVWEISFTLKEF